MEKTLGKRTMSSVLAVLMIALMLPGNILAANCSLYEYTQNFNNTADFENMPTWNSSNDDLLYASGFASTDAYGAQEGAGADGSAAFKLHYDPAVYAKVGTLFYKIENAITGIVEISADMKFVTADGSAETGNANGLLQAMTQTGSTFRGMSTNGGILYAQNANALDRKLSDSYADGKWHNVKWVINTATGEWSITYTDTVVDGEAKESVTVNYTEPNLKNVRIVGFRPVFSTACDMYIDNFSVKQLSHGEFVLNSSSIADGARGAALSAGSVSFNFSDCVDETSARDVKMYRGTQNGTELETTIDVNDNICTLSYPELDETTLYTIVIPSTVKSTCGTEFEGKTISFKTKRSGLDINIDFEGITAQGETEAQRIGYLNKAIADKYGVTSAYAVNYKQLRYTDADEETLSGYNGLHSSWNNVFDGKKNITVEDGKLKLFRSKDCTDSLYYIVYIDPTGAENYKITDGIVNLSFTYEALTKPASTQLFQFGENNRNFKIYLAHGSSSSVFQVGSWGNGGDITSWADFTGRELKFNLKFDFTGEKGRVTTSVEGYENLAKTVELDKKEFDRILFYVDKNESNDVTYTLDDIKISEIKTPQAVCSVADGAEGVSTADNIDITFNTIMSDVTGITLKDEEGNDAAFKLAAGNTGYKYSLRLTEPLKASTKYTVYIPELTSADGLKTAAQAINFTTSAYVPELYISDYTITGTDAIEANGVISVSADFNNTGDNGVKAWLGAALYSADGKLLKIGYAEKTVEKGTPQTLTAAFTVPETVGKGAYINIFAWDKTSIIEPVRAVITD